MNRAERRKAVKTLQKNGVKRDTAKSFINAKSATSKPSSQHLQEGDKVRLAVEKIRTHPDWDNSVESYRRFVEENQGTIFTVEFDGKYKDNPALVCFAEDEQKWLWWEGDLIREKVHNGRP